MAVSPDPTGRADGIGDATGNWARQRPPYQMARGTARDGHRRRGLDRLVD